MIPKIIHQTWYNNDLPIEYINIIEYITSSLLFTLIPIHNDSNIYKFYELLTKLLYK